MRLKIVANKNTENESDISCLIGEEFDIVLIEVVDGEVDACIEYGGTTLFYIHSDEYEIIDGNLGNTTVENYDYQKKLRLQRLQKEKK